MALLICPYAKSFEKGDVLLKIYGDVESKCQRAKDLAIKLVPIEIEGMLIEKVTRKIV